LSLAVFKRRLKSYFLTRHNL